MSKRFIPYPSDARVGTSGLAPVRVLMQDGVWNPNIPIDQRPTLPETPKEVSKTEKKVAYEFHSFRMDTSSAGRKRRKEPARVIPVVAYDP